MSSIDPPVPYHFPEDIRSDAELHIGPLDGPDVLEEEGEPEQTLASRALKTDLPIRRPAIGENLTVEQLEAEIRSND